MTAHDLFCALTTPVAGNVFGLLGTCVLAYAAIRALPSAKALYEVSAALVKLSEQLTAQFAASKAQPPPQNLDALLARMEEQDKAYLSLLNSKEAAISANRSRWTHFDTATTIVGLLLTIASNAMPLAALGCPAPAAPTPLVGAPGNPASGATPAASGASAAETANK